MTDLKEPAGTVDGRVARRQRNVNAVIDVVLEMFAEDSMFPTIEQAATRSGLSLRSLYRYFADPGELLEAAIKRSSQLGTELSHINQIGEGPLADRIDEFVSMRLKLHDRIGAVMRATVANAARHPRVSDELARNRAAMRSQFELQFKPELVGLKPAERKARLAAGDLITQVDSIEYLRRYPNLSTAEIKATMTTALYALLEGPNND